MTWYFSELLFKLGTNGNNQKFCDAAPEYAKVVEMDPTPKAKYLREAAYASVISWKNCLAVEESGEDVQKARVEKRNKVKGADAEEKGEDPRAAADPRSAEEDARSVRHVHQIRARRARSWRASSTTSARVYYEANHFSEGGAASSKAIIVPSTIRTAIWRSTRPTSTSTA